MSDDTSKNSQLSKDRNHQLEAEAAKFFVNAKVNRTEEKAFQKASLQTFKKD